MKTLQPLTAGQADTIAGAYKRLETEREPYLCRYREAATLTIPWLQVEEGHNSTDAMHVPFQSMGARGIRNLASKLMLALLPPGLPFFRLDVPPLVLEQYLEGIGADPQAADEVLTKLDEQLRKIEDAVSSQTETGTIRSKTFAALLEVLAGGTTVYHLREDYTVRVYNLQEFVCQRDASGHLLRTITCEKVDRSVLPEELHSLLEKDEESTELYTDIRRIDADNFEIRQEICGQVIDLPEVHSGKYKADELPWIVLRYSSIDGESYGRSMIEEVIGDLASLEGLSQSFLEMAAAAARTVPMVDPTGVTRLTDVSNAPNLKWVQGRAQDVSAFTIDKRADLAAVRQEMIDLQESLKSAFLMTASIQRNAERVTAEEIRTLSQELESTLGGVYSILAEEFQLPLVRRIMSQMDIDLPSELLTLRITTGVEGVGRGRDAQALIGFGQALGALYGPEAIGKILPLRDAAGRLANAFGVDTTGFNTEEEIQQAEQAAAQAQTLAAVGPDIAKTALNNAQQGNQG